ncbi:MAG TPA: helix-turn-helix domain-containing protein [Pyrinomonadaceae bacterium]
MQPTANFFLVLNFLGAVQALLLAFALCGIKRGNRSANLILAAFSATVSVLIAWTVLNSSGYIYQFPHLFRINHPFDFAITPLLYLYVRALTSTKPQLKKRDLLHFVPFALCIVYLLPYYLQSGADKIYQQQTGLGARWYYLRSALAIPQAIIYLALSGWLIIKYLRHARERRMEAERASLFQVKFLVIALLSVWVVAVFRYLFDMRYPQYMRYTNLVLPFGGTLIIYALAYFGLRQPETFAGADANTLASEDEHSPAKKYEKSTLTSERSEVYLKKLLAAMEREKPYTDGDLTLAKLAGRLAVSTHHLSQIINERLGQNFFDFVNTYRVEEAKRKLVDPARKHYSLLAIAEEVGFNSKSAFNAAFKKQTSMTPSEFRKTSNGNGQH